ncbi:UNVERIFIED_CONTAM: hypothetical protein GTU68_044764 [Idotea baltica]|nr:hypothetical protein [Idotea baltica]
MLYHLFDFLESQFDLPGAGLFQFISFRAAIAVIISLIISLLFGGRLIKKLHNMQVSENVRTLGLDGEQQKKGTPTMGGLIIIGAILIPTILLARLDNVYIILMLVVTVWLGAIGFIDDYIKIFRKDKKGLKPKFKILGQFVVGLIVGLTLYFHPSVQTRATMTTIPFVKSHEFNYASLLSFLVILIIIFISNGCNLTDGIDGLATGVSAIIAFTLGIFCYVSGNTIAADYLNIMYIPHVGEVVVFSAAMIGACLSFLWYNTFPAQVFMGDTGSLMLGGVIASLAIIVRKELLLPILCGIFIIENISVMLQVSYFKYTKKRFGEGRRVFLMAPLHHHYQKLHIHESKIATRFWIVGIMLAIICVLTLKIR